MTLLAVGAVLLTAADAADWREFVGEVGLFARDVFAEFPDGKVIIEGPPWPVHVALVVVAAFCFWLDYKVNFERD